MNTSSPISSIFDSLLQLFWSLVGLLDGLLHLFVEHWPLAIWIFAFLFLVNWPSFRDQLSKGGWLAIVPLYVLISVVWGFCSAIIAEPGSGSFYGIGMPIMLEKFLCVGVWIIVAFLCGAVQDRWLPRPAVPEFSCPADGNPWAGLGGGHDAHGHDDHGHDDHSHH